MRPRTKSRATNKTYHPSKFSDKSKSKRTTSAHNNVTEKKTILLKFGKIEQKIQAQDEKRLGALAEISRDMLQMKTNSTMSFRASKKSKNSKTNLLTESQVQKCLEDIPLKNINNFKFAVLQSIPELKKACSQSKLSFDNSFFDGLDKWSTCHHSHHYNCPDSDDDEDITDATAESDDSEEVTLLENIAAESPPPCSQQAPPLGEFNQFQHTTRDEDLIEKLFVKIEELEEGLREKEAELYYSKKDFDSLQDDKKSKEKILETLQDSIPKVVSDHKKSLEEKDMEIFELKVKNDNLEKRYKGVGEGKSTDVESKGQLEALRKERMEKIIIESNLKEELRMKSEEMNKYKIEVEGRENLKEAEITVLKVKIAGQKNREEGERLLRLKELQSLDYEQKYRVTEQTLHETKQKLELLVTRCESQASRVEQLELDVFSKTAELKSQSTIIAGLNEKLKKC